ncbi:MAG TPA: C2 family cysteine protease [Blastocatellia bacterium]|jgi:hypothetical protein|nr:C2 family cysteine protease [Blastocatellia bacterium]
MILLAQAGNPPVAPAQQQANVSRFTYIEPGPLTGYSLAGLKEGPSLNMGKGPKPEHVTQGAVGNCALPAALAASAHVNPGAVANMISESRADVFSKRESDEIFRYWTTRVITVRFRSDLVMVSSLLYQSGEPSSLIYASSPEPICWLSYIEKAYATLRGGNSYNGLNNLTHPKKVMEDVVGMPENIDLKQKLVFSARSYEDYQPFTDKGLHQILAEAAKCPTIAISSKSDNIVPGIVGNHSYAILGFSDGKVHIYNPHGQDATARADVKLPLDKFKRAFSHLYRTCP